jgi:rhodanese-related sulfurtransferase
MNFLWGHESVAMIDVERAVQEIAQGAQLVDVGEPDDWFAGHLPHATLVEPELADAEFKDLTKDKPVIVAGRNVDAAAGVAGLLHDHGYDVAMIEGGVAAWKAAGHPLIKADGSSA